MILKYNQYTWIMEKHAHVMLPYWLSMTSTQILKDTIYLFEVYTDETLKPE